MHKSLLILTLFLTVTAQAQLFDSIGGTLKDANLGGTLGTGTATPTPADTSFLSYTPDPAVSEQIIQEFVETLSSSGQATPEQVGQMEVAIRESLTREAMQAFIDQLFVGEGFKLDNLADVLAIYFIASFVVLNDLVDGTSTEQDLAVRNQVITAFASVPEIKQLSDADKQKAAEGLILFTIFLANDWQQAQQGVEGYDLNTVKTYTKDTLLQMGIDPAQFDFTPAGLVRKGTTPTQTTTPQTTTPQTTTPTTITPEIQAKVDAMTPEQIQQMAPNCQEALKDPEAAKQAAGGGETGEIALQICQAIVIKAGAVATPAQQTQTQQTQANPLGGTEPAQNPLNPLQVATVDPFAGNFSGQNMALTLSGTGIYTGQLTFNGQTFPVMATSNGQTLTGTFNSGGTDFEFSATLQDSTMTLQSGGSNFTLTKTP